MSALDTQVGGDHYKNLPIQPMQYSMANKLDACQHTAIKYITRFREKGGIDDLEKAKHVIDMLIEFERSGTTPSAPAVAANDNKPDADGWIPHVPGDLFPLNDEIRVIVRLRNGLTQEDIARKFHWGILSHSAGATEIIAWKSAP